MEPLNSLNLTMLESIDSSTLYQVCRSEIKEGNFYNAEKTARLITSKIYKEAAFCDLSKALVKVGHIADAFQIMSEAPRGNLTFPEKDMSVHKISLFLTQQGKFEEAINFALLLPEDSDNRNFSLAEVCCALARSGKKEEAAQVGGMMVVSNETFINLVNGAVQNLAEPFEL